MTTPNRSQVALVTTPTQPTAATLNAIEAAYLEEGYARVWAVVVPHSFEATARLGPWETRVYAEGNPYRPEPAPPELPSFGLDRAHDEAERRAQANLHQGGAY